MKHDDTHPGSTARRRRVTDGPVDAGRPVTAMTPGDGPDAAAVTCANCGDQIDTNEWYPVHTLTDDQYEIYHFCDVACRRAWRDRHAES